MIEPPIGKTYARLDISSPISRVNLVEGKLWLYTETHKHLLNLKLNTTFRAHHHLIDCSNFQKTWPIFQAQDISYQSSTIFPWMIIVYTSFGLYTLTIAVFLLQISTTLRPSFNDCTFHGWNFTPLAPSPLWDVSTVPVPWLRRRQRTTLGAAKRHKDRRPRDNHRLKKADGDGEHTSRSCFFWVVYDLARIQNAEKMFRKQ